MQDFVAKQQSGFLQEKLPPREFLVTVDFVEIQFCSVRCSPVLSLEQFAGNNNIIINPSVAYYLNHCVQNTGFPSQLKNIISFAMISENNKQDTIAVHFYQKFSFDFQLTVFLSQQDDLFF